jgi:hypothetical protein
VTRARRPALPVAPDPAAPAPSPDVARRRGGVIALLALLGLCGGAGLIAWQRAQEAERADQRPAPLGPDPRSTEVAADVARRFHEHLAARRFVEALPMADGAAAERVSRELSQQLGPDGRRDPALMRVVEGVMTVQVVSFETTSVEPQDQGSAVVVRARAVVAAQGQQLVTRPRFLLRWRFDDWAVKEYTPDERAPASAPGPTR